MATATTEPKPRSPQGREPIKDEEWARWIRDIVDHFEVAEEPVRERMVRTWRKQECYWDHIQYVWWSEVAHDWRTPEQAADEFGNDPNFMVDPSLYAKIVNIYRAHGEVIIAAMSASIPKVIFPPDDADNPDDVLTSKSRGKLAEIIYRHNHAEMLLMRALYLLYNQGLVFGYNENYQSPEYGQVDVPIFGDVPVRISSSVCPHCLAPLSEEAVENVDELPPEEEMAPPVGEQMGEAIPPMEAPPMEGNVPPTNITEGPPQPQPVQCPECGNLVVPEEQSIYDTQEQEVGSESKDKCREVMSVWGPLNVKIPAWTRRLKDTPYVILETEEHYAMLQSLYPEISESIQPGSDADTWDRQMRTPNKYEGDQPRDLQTVKRCWLRPWAFNVLGVSAGNLEKVEQLNEMFPDGLYAVIIGHDLLAEAVPDKMDDHWSCTHHPLSETLHASSLGAPEMPVQEMTNELVNLTLESIEHQIPETYADSEAIDFESYGESEARPGMLYPAKKTPGESLGNSFYEVKGGSLSKEVAEFGKDLERFGQFVVGSLPSVFGGAIEGGSNTAREYELSRSQALQRLGITWKFITTWWTQFTEKAVNSYAANMSGDERYVSDKGGGNFVNVWVRQSQMSGNTGEAYAEASESIPYNWNQKRDVLLMLLNMKDPMIMSVLSHPENAGLVSRLIGLSELYIPGDDDRLKQLREIQQLIMSVPEETIDPMGPPQGVDEMGMLIPSIKEVSSVPIDPELDNHPVEGEVGKAWLKSEVGLEMKEKNPGAYYNVLLHTKEHLMMAAQQAMAQMEAEAAQNQGPGGKPGEKSGGPPEKSKGGPPKGPQPDDRNVSPIQS